MPVINSSVAGLGSGVDSVVPGESWCGGVGTRVSGVVVSGKGLLTPKHRSVVVF